MRKITKGLSIAMLVMFVGLMFSSCEKETSEYQVRIQNNMYEELSLLGVSSPWFKYNVEEFTLGGLSFENIPYGEYSEYQTIESSTDYEASVTYTQYLWNSETYTWEKDGTYTEDLGTISWVDDETYVLQKIKLEVGDLLSGYAPVYKKYGEE